MGGVAVGAKGVDSPVVATGWRMPAEWERHEATWMAWPVRRSDWPGKFVPALWSFVELVRLVAGAEPVRLVVPGREVELVARTTLEKAGVALSQVRFFHCPTDRNWLRDSGPMFVLGQDGRLAVAGWDFDGWGRFRTQHDRHVARKIAEALGCEWLPCGAVLEGGAIDVNGQGLLLATEECLLGRIGRRWRIDRGRWEQLFRAYLGVEDVIWLPWGLGDDETGGHVDQVARFIGPKRVAAAYAEDPRHPDCARLQANWRVLESWCVRRGLELVRLPMPAPVYFARERLPASYLNFYIANGLVVVPVFNDPEDRVALDTLARAFPDRQVVGLYSRDLVLGEGGPHCLTQQQPAGPGSGAVVI